MADEQFDVEYNPHIFGKHMDDYMNTPEIAPGVFVEPGSAVYIVDEHGEVMSWNEDEWKDDAYAVTATVNAAILAALRGPSAVYNNIEHKDGAINELIDETRKSCRPGPSDVEPPLVSFDKAVNAFIANPGVEELADLQRESQRYHKYTTVEKGDK